MKMKVLYITTSLPSLTLTFIYREIFALRKRNFEILTASMNRPPQNMVSRESKELLKTTLFLDGVTFYKLLMATISTMIRKPFVFVGNCKLIVCANPINSLKDYVRLLYHLMDACYIYQQFREKSISHIHCHFISGPTSIGMFLSKLLNIPFSFTMHASLIWRDPIALSNKLTECKFCASISNYNTNYVVKRYGSKHQHKIHTVRCGIPTDMKTTKASKYNDSAILNILSIGQLTERKGFHILIEACFILLRNGLKFHCTIIGEGEQRPILQNLIKSFNLENQVTLAGAMPQEKIRSHFQENDVFVMPCMVTNDGHRDGIPVALMEAMLFELPVVTTNILGLPELVEHGVNGVLVEPNNAYLIADAVNELYLSQSYRKKLGKQGAQKIFREFNSERSALKLEKLICS